MIRTLGRHFRESLKSLGRNAWMTFASVGAVTVTLFLVGTFLVIMMNLNHIATNLEENVEIRVLIEPTSTSEEAQQLRAQIEGIPEVNEVGYSPKEEELENLINSFGEEGSSFQLFEQNNPLNDVYVVKAANPQDTTLVAQQIETFDHAFKVRYGQEQVERLFDVVNVARNIGIALIIGLVFTAMFLISNTIKITIFARRREIEIMKLVGATNWFIRWPFFIEGLLLGVFGAVIPIAVIATGYHYLFNFAEPRVRGSFAEILPMYPFIFQIALVLLLIGALIGVWGSLTSIRKFLKV
ncbi:FtsX-like permease family protein [Bacillus lacus]|uniref:Cell division protein FtsX n=1 Tax=Metabacillus lacus TaxID=1983721 RepID=A0A7X2IYM7_9BACI|nr:permease-like cell division protein FtsX [Metabacillus lacus]MRX72213.1 FtsX-like permease family protein [Metabacillus lacus]